MNNHASPPAPHSTSLHPFTPAVPYDSDPKFTAYAHPERLVSASWLEEQLRKRAENPGDGSSPKLVVLECDEDVLLYETGHIPGAVKIDWHTDLNDQLQRDYLHPESFAAFCEAKGIGCDDTLVFYGDKANWWATYALWVFSLYGHRDMRLLDGGRDFWMSSGRPLTTEATPVFPTEYPVLVRDDAAVRALRDDVPAAAQLVDVRSPREYTGELTHMPNYPQEGATRGGHIPGALSVPWGRAVAEDSRFLPREQLEAVYLREAGLDSNQQVTAYCRIGERSSHTWFALKYLLGFPNVLNYDGSWTEWGNLVRAPIAVGEEPGPKITGLL